MKITLNNRLEAFNEDKLTITQLLDLKNYTFKMLVIKINGKLVKKDLYDSVEVKDEDDVTILHLVSGG